MDSMALATSAAAVYEAARAARDASGVLDDLLVNGKFKDDPLRLDVKQFQEATDALHSRLARPPSSESYGGEEQQGLHAKLRDAMAICAGTFNQLTLHARDAGKAKSGIFRQGRKLSAKDEVIIRAKQRIPVHTLTVQLLSGTFNVRCILQDPHLSGLSDNVWNLQQKRARLQSSCQVNSPHLGQDSKLCDSVASLIAETSITLEHATTALEDSSRSIQDVAASSSVRSAGDGPHVQISYGASDRHLTSAHQLHLQQQHLQQQHLQQQRIVSHSNASLASPPLLPQETVLWPPRSELAIQDVELITPVSTALPTEGNSTVIRWIDNLGEREDCPRRLEDTSAASVVSSSGTISETRSAPIGERLSSGDTLWTLPSISGSSRKTMDMSEIDDFDKDGITVELARNIIFAGQDALDSGDHKGAKDCFLEALTLIHELPYKTQGVVCDMLDLRYHMAMCCLVLDGQTEVEKALLEVLQHEPSSDMQREKLLHASHALAQLYITTGRLALARRSCNDALRGRRRLLGKDHQDYYSSLALMARISELDHAEIQAKAYKDMIPAAEQHKYAFGHLKMDVFCEKEVVELTDAERPSPSSEPKVQNLASQSTSHRAADLGYGAGSTIVDRQMSFSQESVVRPTVLPIREASTVQTSIAPQDPHSYTMYSRFSQVSDTVSETARIPHPLSIARSQEPTHVPLPNPGNDYLGFCRAAWQLQAGDRSAFKKTKQSSLSSPTTYWLCCTGPKCHFTTEIETSVIGTWESVETKHQKRGVVYRFPFLAKSHVRQNKVAAGQALYKCVFCIFLGMQAPIIQGTEGYIDHVAQKHRASDLSQVVLYRTSCVNDRICAVKESFDINIYP